MKLTFTIALYLFLSAASHAEVYKIAAYSWKPFIDVKRDDGGISIAIIRKALQNQGHDISLDSVPFARAMVMLKAEKVDILPAMWHSEERAETMLFSDSYAANRLVFIKSKGNNFEFNGLPSLHGKKVGVIRDYGYGEEFLNDKKIKFSISKSLDSNVAKLVAGRIDLTVEDEIVSKTVIKPELLEKIAFTSQALSESPLYITCNKTAAKCKALIDAFNAGLKAITADGSLHALLNP